MTIKVLKGLSHQLEQFVIDGNKVILSSSNPKTRVDEAEFEENEVYAIGIVSSTGKGKPKLLDEKQTPIYKRAVNKNYHLKMKTSRFIFREISQNSQSFLLQPGHWKEKRASSLDSYNVSITIFWSHILFFMISLV